MPAPMSIVIHTLTFWQQMLKGYFLPLSPGLAFRLLDYMLMSTNDCKMTISFCFRFQSWH